MNSRCSSGTRFAAIAAFAVIAFVPVSTRASAAAIGACPTPAPEAVQKSSVTVAAIGTATKLDLRVADTFAKREYGLMCVHSLEPGSGMIFVFADGNQKREFWMKNTLIPLDMVFVAKDGRVTSVAANVPGTTVTTPDEAIPRRSGTGAYVIELAAGDASRRHVGTGTHLDLSGVTPAKE